LNILNHINIAGVKVHRASANVAAFWVLKRLNAGKRTKVTPVNAAVIVAASRDPIFNQSLKIFDLSIADFEQITCTACQHITLLKSSI
jgi:UDP-N-acetyl-D-mannosaminuronic acid transferase (WecB/TagA/CpsF family)